MRFNCSFPLLHAYICEKKLLFALRTLFLINSQFLTNAVYDITSPFFFFLSDTPAYYKRAMWRMIIQHTLPAPNIFRQHLLSSDLIRVKLKNLRKKRAKSAERVCWTFAFHNVGRRNNSMFN